VILVNEIAARTDCTDCANCCRYTIVDASRDEIGAIAGYLDMTVDQVIRMYTDPDEIEPSKRILRNRHDACVFLDGNLCMIYDVRPAACRDFPAGGSFSAMCRRATVCPIIDNALEAYKTLVGYRAAGR
jgi:Fe-S-cluster containining protein